MGHLWGAKEETLLPFKLITNHIRPNHPPSEWTQEAQSILLPPLSNQGHEMDFDGLLDGGQQTVLQLRQRREKSIHHMLNKLDRTPCSLETLGDVPGKYWVVITFAPHEPHGYVNGAYRCICCTNRANLESSWLTHEWLLDQAWRDLIPLPAARVNGKSASVSWP